LNVAIIGCGKSHGSFAPALREDAGHTVTESICAYLKNQQVRLHEAGLRSSSQRKIWIFRGSLKLSYLFAVKEACNTEISDAIILPEAFSISGEHFSGSA